MKMGIIIFLMLSVLFAEQLEDEAILEKIIIGSSHTQESLEEIKSYCNENSTIYVLQKKYHFKIEMERLGDYNVSVITPIKSISVRNTLLILLTPQFQDVFYVKQAIEQNSNKKVIQEETITWMYYGIGLQWITLLLLSMIGLFLSIKSRKKMKALLESQKALEEEQQKMEQEIKSLGDKE